MSIRGAALRQSQGEKEPEKEKEKSGGWDFPVLTSLGLMNKEKEGETDSDKEPKKKASKPKGFAFEMTEQLMKASFSTNSLPESWSVVHQAAVSVLLEVRKKTDFTKDPVELVLEERKYLDSLPLPVPNNSYTYRPVDANGIPCEWVIHKKIVDQPPEKYPLLIHFHGGTFISLHPPGFHQLAASIGKRAHKHMRILLPDYRLTPEFRFPAPVEDCAKVYQWVLSQGYRPNQIAVSGDSTGGNLALTTLFKARQMGLPFPGCVVLMSPWVDLDYDGQKDENGNPKRKSLVENFGRDIVDPRFDGLCARLYLNGHDPRDPLASPLFGDFMDFPPTLIQTGAMEVTRDEIVELADRMKAAGVKVELEVFADEIHDFQNFSTSPSRINALEKIGAFLVKHTKASE